jgi:hypothetical protein
VPADGSIINRSVAWEPAPAYARVVPRMCDHRAVEADHETFLERKVVSEKGKVLSKGNKRHTPSTTAEDDVAFLFRSGFRASKSLLGQTPKALAIIARTNMGWLRTPRSTPVRYSVPWLCSCARCYAAGSCAGLLSRKTWACDNCRSEPVDRARHGAHKSVRTRTSGTTRSDRDWRSREIRQKYLHGTKVISGEIDGLV